jgi:peptidoglycan/xylan/chitin deacetylase (PgdA/CDA1 family)
MTLIVTTSWDDGHISDMQLADLLDAYSIRGTFYVAPKSIEIDRASRLTNKQLRELAGRFEIGGHTLTHRRLPKLPIHAAEDEIRSGKLYLEDVIERQLYSFCYPRGEYGSEHVGLVRDAGFVTARTVRRWECQRAVDLLQMGTTVHAYRHYTDVGRIGKGCLSGPAGAAKKFWNWDDLAIDLFDRVAMTGGIFHLWGHSWEVESNNDWHRLERVLDHIALRDRALYATNGELAHCATESQRKEKNEIASREQS